MALRSSLMSMRCIAAIGVLGGACAADSAFADISYNAIYLGGIGGNQTHGTQINDNGQVVGFATDPFNTLRAFHYYNGVMTVIPILPGGDYNIAYGINNNGQAVGFSSTGSGSEGFIYDVFGQSVTGIGVLPGGTYGGGLSLASGINDEGYVVGRSYYRSTDWAEHAVLYDPYSQTLTALGTLGSDEVSVARGINNSNQIVGSSLATVGSDAHRLFFYDSGSMTDVHTIAVDQLGLSNVFNTMAKDINDSGEVLGTAFIGTNYSDPSGYYQSFIYYSDNPFDAVVAINNTLGGYSTSASGFNDNGQVVGNSYDGVANTAFLYDLFTQSMTDLNTAVNLADWRLTGATSVNALGQILATAEKNGQFRTFLLSPITESTAPVAPDETGYATVAVNGGSGSTGGVMATFYESRGTFHADYSLNVASELEPQTTAFNFSLAGDGIHVQVWNLFFDGSTVGVPARITLAYDESLLPSGADESLLAIYHFTSGQWVLVDNLAVDTAANTISFDTHGFSPFALGVIPEPTSLALFALPAAFMLRRRRA